MDNSSKRIRQKALQGGRKQGVQRIPMTDLTKRRIVALYEECARLNAIEEQYVGSANYWTIDHVRPISYGGLHEIMNLRLLRSWANTAARDRTEEYIKMTQKALVSCLIEPGWPQKVDWQCQKIYILYTFKDGRLPIYNDPQVGVPRMKI